MSAASSPTAYMFSQHQVPMSRDGSTSSMPPRSLSRAGGYDEQTLRERARRPSMASERVPFLQPPPSPRSRLRAKFSSSNLKEDRNDVGNGNGGGGGGTLRAPSYEKVLAERERGHKHSSSVDSDTASIASFGCVLAEEFDRQARDQASMGMDSVTRQHWLNGMFNKLSRKKSYMQSRSHGGLQRSGSTATDASIEEEATPAPPPRKPKPHFLDLSGYINPVPSVVTLNVTPRPTDAQRFASSHTDSTTNSSSGSERRGTASSAAGHQASSSVGSNATFGPNSAKAPQLLRSRRSAESLGESRRRQKQDWSAAATAGQTPPQPRLPSGPPGSAAMQTVCSQDSWTSASSADSSVPTLPSWARESNRNLSISSQGSSASSASAGSGGADSFYTTASQAQYMHQQPPRSHTPDAASALTTFQAVAGRTPRPAAMTRAASHDQHSGTPHRPVMMQRGTSNQLPTISAGHVPQSLLESFAGLQPGSVIPRGVLNGQRSHGNLREGARSPDTRREGAPSPTINRTQRVARAAPRSGSISSGTGGDSSVPQTPIRSVAELPSVKDDDFFADALSAKLSDSPQDGTLPLRRSPPRAAARTADYVARTAEVDTSLTSDDENELLAGAGRYSLHSHSATSSTVDSNMVTPRAFTAALTRRGPHVANIFPDSPTHAPAYTPSSPTRTSSRVSQREATRPRASTVSSVSRTNSASSKARKQLTEADHYADADEEVSRISYLSQGSNASSASAASSASSAAPVSPGRRSANGKADEWGSSIGRKFARRGTNGKPPKLPLEEEEGTLPYINA